MLRFEFVPAFVLHTRPYQETSLLLELFTETHGRLSAIAKGARRPKARARGLLQPFVSLLVSCAGRGELLTLKNFDPSGFVTCLQGRALISAFYLNELLMRMMHRFDPHPELFEIYKNTLEMLKHPEQAEIALRLFEKSLLKALGYELQFTKEAETGDLILDDAWYAFDPERGPIFVHKNSNFLNLKYSHMNDKLFKGKTLNALAQNRLEEKSILSDAKRIMRRALKVHLGGRPLESRRLF